MARKQVGQLDADLLARVDERAEELGQTRVVFISRALERALSEAQGPSGVEQADPGPVPSSEGVRSAAPARESAGRAPAYQRRALVDPFPKGK